MNVSTTDPIHLFEEAARRWPLRPALRLDGRTITYAELDGWGNAIAHRIIRKGYGGARIALMAEKKAGSYATILGILKAGSSYVPLPPDGPADRWSTMIAKAGVRAMVGGRSVNDLDLIDPSAEGNTTLPVRPAYEEAYVLFTSGSTGGPKGVSVSRSNVAAYLRHQLVVNDFNETDRFSQFFALTFDLSVHDLFVCWSVGACLCVPTGDQVMRAVAFAQEEGITVWFSVPSLLVLQQRMRALGADVLPKVRKAFFCGEAFTWPVARAFAAAAPHAQLVNLYGPTETTIAITGYVIDRGAMAQEGVVPIGRPFEQAGARMVDEELELSGPQLAAGYVGDPSATARAFRSEQGARWYRTGDRVWMDDEYVLHYLGRLDDQVKIMGHRVEPAEVDAALVPVLGGQHAITLPRVEAGTIRLYTFVQGEVDQPRLMNELRRALPSYMLPERIIGVDRMPVTAHGKLDRKALLDRLDHG